MHVILANASIQFLVFTLRRKPESKYKETLVTN